MIDWRFIRYSVKIIETTNVEKVFREGTMTEKEEQNSLGKLIKNIKRIDAIGIYFTDKQRTAICT